MKTNPCKRKAVVDNSAKEWLYSFLLYAAIFMFFMYYHKLRGKPYSLFTANKCAGIAATLGVSLTLFLGPWSRLSGRYAALLAYRRPLGLTASAFVLVHAVLSLFFLADNFPLKYFSGHQFSVLCGTVSFLLLAIIAVISNSRSLKRLGYRKWKFVQSLSYLCLTLALLHFVVLGKFANWLKWFRSPDYIYPPGTMLPFFAGVLVLLLFLVDRAAFRRKSGGVE